MADEKQPLASLPKAPTGIQGLDEITFGGLPTGRPTLIVGGAGSGKTMISMEFLVRGATQFGEPGVFVAFEETPQDLAANFASRGYDLEKLEEEQKILIEYIYIERSEIEETGEYDLEALFIRLADAIDTIGAKRVVLDTIEVLFAGLSNTAILRAELRRLFRFLKEKGVTAIVTGERGDGTLTRYGLEEYVADCVILLDHRMQEQVATRRLRVLKYRGSEHATNEFPFLIEDSGISVLPITSLRLEHKAPMERVPTGIPALDEMMGGEGYYRASSILITGTAGTGKTSIAVSFAKAACERGEKVLYFAFEESPDQILRNMKSIGIDLEHCRENGSLTFHAIRPTQYGLETHLVEMIKLVRDINPFIVIVDPISNLMGAGQSLEVRSMLTRLVDYLKSTGRTSLFTSLTSGETFPEYQEIGISSLMDTWISVRNIETGGERNRGLYVLKSRGTSHSNRVREFRLTHHGIELLPVYVGPQGLLTGTAKEAQIKDDRAAEMALQQDAENVLRSLDQKRNLLEARIAAMRAEYETEEADTKRRISQARARRAAANWNTEGETQRSSGREAGGQN